MAAATCNLVRLVPHHSGRTSFGGAGSILAGTPSNSPMNATKLLLRLLSLGCMVMVVPAAVGKAITNGTDCKDTNSRLISAHAHFVGRFFGAFYWYASSYNGKPLGQCG